MREHDTIAVVDNGGQFAHLIATKVRDKVRVKTVIMDPRAEASEFEGVKGIILSGGPDSIHEEGSVQLNNEILDLDVPVLTDGLSPENTAGVWASLATPEAAEGGVVGRLRDGDFLRLDLAQGLIRTGVEADEIRRRESLMVPGSPDFGYAARYARTALPPLDGAGFG